MDNNKSMKLILQDYVSGKINFTPIMNIMMNNRNKDWYSELGKYIESTIDIERVPELEFLSNRIKKKKGSIVTKIKNFIVDDDRLSFSIASFFLTSALNDKSLRKIFGNPLFHNEFGEGFDKKRFSTYASYFVNVCGTNFHIGYDHRGTRIEIELKTIYTDKTVLDVEFSDIEVIRCLESLKKIVDLYKEKAL